MKVKDIMSSDVECVRPNDTAQEAAIKMEELNVCLLPVGGKIEWPAWSPIATSLYAAWPRDWTSDQRLSAASCCARSFGAMRMTISRALSD